jgi:cupin superfamily acireductone dioxygenase involved in methionine salvage
MSSEAQVILDVWEAVRDHIPHAKRAAIAQDIVYAFEEYGFEGTDCASIMDEDPDLATAFQEVFSDEDDDEEEEIG